MSWTRRIRWRRVIVGSVLWLILLSSISLQEGHPKLSQWTGTAAIAVIVLAVLVGVLRLLGLLLLAAVHPLRRQIARSRRRRRPRAGSGARRTAIRR